jgi:MOSC domain-containing protein YiiM
VTLQISQPRQPCWKLGRKWRMDHLPRLVVETGRTGWYFRVLRAGYVGRGAALSLRQRSDPAWTIAAANAVMHGKPFTRERASELMGVEGLSESWRQSLLRKLDAVSGSGSSV